MKKNNLIKILIGISTSILLGMGINLATHFSTLVHAADTGIVIGTSTDKTVNIMKDKNGKVYFESVLPTIDVTVKNDNPVLIEIDNDKNIKSEKSNYEAGQTVKVEYSYDLKNTKTGERVTVYYIKKKIIDGKEYGVFILAEDVNTSVTIPTKDEYTAAIKADLSKAKKEYDEKQAEALKKRFLYYTAKKKSTKKTLYYYTLYRKTTTSKKTKKNQAIYGIKKNKYSIKAKSLKLETPVKFGKTVYYHVKGKSANFWVRSTDVKDLKPVFRKN